MRPCRHGFDPEVGPGLWCPACDFEKELPALVRLYYRFGLDSAFFTVLCLVLSVTAFILSAGLVLGWWGGGGCG